MNKTEFIDFYKNIAKIAKKNLEKDGYITPIFFLLDKNGIINSIIPHFDNIQTKHLSIIALRQLIQKLGIIAAIQVSDAWQTKIDRNTGQQEKTECIMCAYSDLEKNTKCHLMPYKQIENKKYKFAKEIDMNNNETSGFMFSLFDRKEYIE